MLHAVYVHGIMKKVSGHFLQPFLWLQRLVQINRECTCTHCETTKEGRETASITRTVLNLEPKLPTIQNNGMPTTKQKSMHNSLFPISREMFEKCAQCAHDSLSRYLVSGPLNWWFSRAREPRGPPQRASPITDKGN